MVIPSDMRHLIRRSRPAMASLFEVMLAGDDPEHLDAVAAAAMEEIGRVERLLSRHDPAAELARVNREAADRPAVVDVELFELLRDCLAWARRTGGAFDPCVPSGRFVEDVGLDADRRSVRLANPAVRIDLGGFGKGYALDRAAELIASFGVDSLRLHGGTSSVRTLGTDANGRAWIIGLRDPFAPPGIVAGADWFESSDGALSCSAVFDPGSNRSDLLDPATGRPLERPTACAVIAPTAAEAEALSTALLVMGRGRAAAFVASGENLPHTARVAWMEQVDGSTLVEWWSPEPEPTT